MSIQKIRFINRSGNELPATMEFPDAQDPHSYAILAHCFICANSLMATHEITHSLTTNGIAVLRFDFTGQEGRSSDKQFSSSVEDLMDAGMYLAENYQAPSLLIGHSLGGAAALFAASKMSSVRAVASIGAPYSIESVLKIMNETSGTGEEGVGSTAEIGGNRFTISEDFLDDLRRYDMKEILSVLRIPVLFLHSPQDRTVGIENAQKIYEYARHPKSFVALDGATHLLAAERDAEYAGRVIASWAARYLDVPRRVAPRTHHQVAVSLGNKGYTAEVIAGKHLLIADEPEDHGGKDYGPSPYEYLSTALGACTAMTLRMYADRKKWDLQKVVVHLDHRKDYPGDIDAVEKGNEKIDHIDRRIEIHGDLDETQRARLIEIANKCPVHKTLRNSSQINTKQYKS